MNYEEEHWPAYMKKKKTKRDCGGKKNKPHTPEIARSKYYGHLACRPGRIIGKPYWMCWHIIRCSECGKILDDGLAERCPDYLTD